MTMDHSTFEERLDDLDNIDRLPADLAEHARLCDRCQARLDLARRIRSTAPALTTEEISGHGDLAADVVARTHQSPSRTPQLLRAAAALVVVAGATAVYLNTSNPDADRLAEIAAEYESSGEVRFVYATDASIDVVDAIDITDTASIQPRAMSTQIPTCDDAPASEDGEAGGALDLAPISEALASNDPCLVLQLIDETATTSRDAFVGLAASIDRAETINEQLITIEPDTPLAEASIDAYLANQVDSISDAEQTLADLEQSFTTLANTLQPLATTQQQTLDPSIVESGLVALRTDTSAAEQAIIATDQTVNWTQIATGTWRPTGIEIEALTERGEDAAGYNGVDNDPLALAQVVLTEPATLLALLGSAPSGTDLETRWAVPPGILDTTTEWEAIATIADGQLVQIRLESSEATITFTPQR